jgi:hypothetical protein
VISEKTKRTHFLIILVKMLNETKRINLMSFIQKLWGLVC